MQEKVLKSTKTLQRASSPHGKAVLQQMRRNASTPNLSVQKPLPFMKNNARKTITNYFLLPQNDPGLVAFFLDALNPFMSQYKPTFGVSYDEASKAQRVILVGGEQSFSGSLQNKLQSAGCNVYQISGDGTEIATILAER